MSNPMPSRGCLLPSISAATLLATAASLLVPASSLAQSFQFGASPALFEDVVLTPTLVPAGTTVRGISGGPLQSSDLAGRPETNTGPCLGFMDTAPDHQITLTGFFDYLSLEIQSPEDTTLLVRGPGGSWCSDDVYGFNPAIAGQWFSGTYDIWVGSYRPSTYHPYVIRISETPPEPVNPIQPLVPPLSTPSNFPATPPEDPFPDTPTR